MYDEFFSKAWELLSEGRPFATAVVVRAEKPTSARPGDKAIVTPDGVMHGWIGGSCAQPSVIEQARQAMADGQPRLIRLSPDPNKQHPREGLMDLPMTCFSGGTLELYIEPQLPQPRLLLVGSLPVAQSLARLAHVMNYYVIVVDPDTEGASIPEADETVASHGHYDEIGLEHALQSQAAYVALVASKNRSVSVLEYLSAQGLSKSALARLKYPAGLDIQAMRGDEIALSIMAEIVQIRRNAGPIDVELLAEELQATTHTEEPVAIDPVCGMSVKVADAHYKYEYDGQTYYFCAASCRQSFAENPERYLDHPVPAGEAIDPVCGMTVEIASAQFMSEYEGELYYFCAAGCKTSFDENPLAYLKSSGVAQD
jgi:xanthine dehydrogenase accessory factor